MIFFKQWDQVDYSSSRLDMLDMHLSYASSVARRFSSLVLRLERFVQKAHNSHNNPSYRFASWSYIYIKRNLQVNGNMKPHRCLQQEHKRERQQKETSDWILRKFASSSSFVPVWLVWYSSCS